MTPVRVGILNDRYKSARYHPSRLSSDGETIVSLNNQKVFCIHLNFWGLTSCTETLFVQRTGYNSLSNVTMNEGIIVFYYALLMTS